SASAFLVLLTQPYKFSPAQMDGRSGGRWMDKPQYSPTYQIKVNLNAPAAAPHPPQAVPYIDYLKQVHRVCKPTSYFEIGVETGQTLVFADCPSVAVDPDLTNLAANPIGVKS